MIPMPKHKNTISWNKVRKFSDIKEADLPDKDECLDLGDKDVNSLISELNHIKQKKYSVKA